MAINQNERSVLLVGSVPLSSAEAVFEAVSSELGPVAAPLGGCTTPLAVGISRSHHSAPVFKVRTTGISATSAGGCSGSAPDPVAALLVGDTTLLAVGTLSLRREKQPRSGRLGSDR